MDTLFGDGSDGDIVFNGMNAYDFAIYNPETKMYTLLRDVQCEHFSISLTLGVTVRLAGHKLLVRNIDARPLSYGGLLF